MNYQSPLLEWVTIPDWQEGSLPNLAETGLLRFRLDGRVVFIGYATSAKTGLRGRIAAYRRGDIKTHRANQKIAQIKHRLELQVAVLYLSPTRLREIAQGLRAKERPILNEKNPYAGRI